MSTTPINTKLENMFIHACRAETIERKTGWKTILQDDLVELADWKGFEDSCEIGYDNYRKPPNKTENDFYKIAHKYSKQGCQVARNALFQYEKFFDR